MAKQTGDTCILGTIDDLCFYQMEGRYYVRLRSSLAGKRFWKDSAFAGSRRSCGLLAQASVLASQLYRQLPKGKKGRPVYQQLTGKIKVLLQQGQSEAEIITWWEQHYWPQPAVLQKKPGSGSRRKQVRKGSLVILPPVERVGWSAAGKMNRKRRRNRYGPITDQSPVPFPCSAGELVLPSAGAG